MPMMNNGGWHAYLKLIQKTVKLRCLIFILIPAFTVSRVYGMKECNLRVPGTVREF